MERSVDARNDVRGEPTPIVSFGSSDGRYDSMNRGAHPTGIGGIQGSEEMMSEYGVYLAESHHSYGEITHPWCWRMPVPAFTARPQETSLYRPFPTDVRQTQNWANSRNGIYVAREHVSPQPQKATFEGSRNLVDVRFGDGISDSPHLIGSQPLKVTETFSPHHNMKGRRVHNISMVANEVSPPVMPTTATPRRSKSIPVKRNRRSEEEALTASDASCNERMYDWATWRMYHRITSARKGRSAVPVKQVAPMHPGVENWRLLTQYQAGMALRKQGATFPMNSETPDIVPDDSMYGEVFELEI